MGRVEVGSISCPIDEHLCSESDCISSPKNPVCEQMVKAAALAVKIAVASTKQANPNTPIIETDFPMKFAESSSKLASDMGVDTESLRHRILDKALGPGESYRNWPK